MIPEFNALGLLPSGVHLATLEEVFERFGGNEQRQRLLQGLVEAINLLKAANCRCIYIDGSFVTAKEHPNDIDACWDITGINPAVLDPIFRNFDNGRAAQKGRFGAEFFPASLPEGVTGKTFLDFFQIDRQTGEPKGIIEVRLDGR